MAKHDSSDGGSYNFCDVRGRRSFYEQVLDDYEELSDSLRKEGGASRKRAGNIRVDFHFESSEGLRTIKRFRSLEKLEHFLFWEKGYPQLVKSMGSFDSATGHNRFSMKKPDWSHSGLCQYTKTIELGVSVLVGDKEIEWKPFRIYYGE